jgi:hypothetical protein
MLLMALASLYDTFQSVLVVTKFVSKQNNEESHE